MAETLADIQYRKLKSYIQSFGNPANIGTVPDMLLEYYWLVSNITTRIGGTVTDHQRSYWGTQLSNVNKVTNPGFEVDVNGWTQISGGATLTRDITVFNTGVASGKQVNDGTVGSQGPLTFPFVAASPSTLHTARVFLKGNIGGETVNISLTRSPSANGGSNISIVERSVVLTTAWQEFTVAGETPNTQSFLSLFIYEPALKVQTFFIDDAKILASPGKLSMEDLENSFYDLKGIAAGSLSDREYAYWTGVVL